MLHTYSLKAEERSSIGTGPARDLRRKGLTPGIIYGAGKQPVMIAVSSKEITQHYHKQGFLSHMFDIEVGNNKHRTIPKSVQLHPVTDEIEHIDFMHVNEKEKIKINVTLHFINEAKCPGIKQGGILNVARHSLEVYCLPSNIPESIEIDMAELSINQSIHVSDLKLPEGVETKLSADTSIATIAAGKASEASTQAAE